MPLTQKLRDIEVNGKVVRDMNFADDALIRMVNQFYTPLLSAGVTATAAEIINQWHELLDYAAEFISLQSTPYRVTWRKLFAPPRCTEWKDILVVIELLFMIPICNAKLERMFSKLKYVKTDFRACLSAERLENILRIIEDGPAIENRKTQCLQSICGHKVRRPNQSKRKPYKSRVSRKHIIGSLSDSSTSDSDLDMQEEEATIYFQQKKKF